MGRWVEIAATVLLALAAVATAWASYQAARWNGKQARATILATASRVEASRISGDLNREIQIDVATFIQWVDAYTAGDARLAGFYFRRFRKEFRPAVAAWVRTKPLRNRNAPLTPFAMPQYHPAALAETNRLEATAATAAEATRVDIERSNRYVLAVVLFAMSLFFAGISTRLEAVRSRAIVVCIGWAIFLTAVGWMATFPVSVQL